MKKTELLEDIFLLPKLNYGSIRPEKVYMFLISTPFHLRYTVGVALLARACLLFGAIMT